MKDVKKERWSKFCSKCGKKTDELFDSLCKECFIEGVRLIEAENLEISVCKSCGGYFKGHDRTSIEDAVDGFIRRRIRRKFGSDVEVEGVEEEIKEEKGKKRAEVFLAVKAVVRGVEIEERGELEVILKTETCERCSKIAGGYHEAIVQIRAKDRVPTEEELAIATKIAYSCLRESDFISKEEALKKGLDIFVSSIKSGRKISKEIVKKLGGSVSESRKLYGRRDGRDVYRVSFSVRLPGFKEGKRM